MDHAAETIMPLMMQTDRCHRMIIEGQVDRLGVHRTQHMILMCVSQCDKPPTQTEIAELFEVSSAAVAVSLKKMEQSGLILRTPRKGNARVKEIRLTEKGSCMVEKTKKLFEAVGHAALKGIPEEELDVMRACMEKIKRNLENYRPDTQKGTLSERTEEAEQVEEMV
ncbi:MAG: MarR family transcriptional regulator [Clostridia bacterium]|nr:MarR family transcriptional regulator [Clostridia bacterium]